MLNLYSVIFKKNDYARLKKYKRRRLKNVTFTQLRYPRPIYVTGCMTSNRTKTLQLNNIFKYNSILIHLPLLLAGAALGGTFDAPAEDVVDISRNSE